MHSTIMLLGCALGFGTGFFAYFSLGLGLFLSLSIWAASGPVTLLMIFALYALRNDAATRPHDQQPEIA